MCSYNEIGRIEKAYEDVLNSLKSRQEKVEILFIDNGSTDGTREWLRTISNPIVRIIFNEKNLGKGGSIKKGIRLSRGKYIVIHDPDFEYRAEDVWKCYDFAKKNKAVFVLGSRVLGGKVKYHYYLNYLGVKFLTSMLNILYQSKLTDAATALKLLDGEIIRKINLCCNGFDLDFELITRIARLGGKIMEIPAQYYPRTVEQGKKIRPFRDGLMALKVIITDRFILKTSLLKNEQA